MNKLFLIILAVCLISVHCGVVKRDTESATPNILENAQKALNDFSKSFSNEFAKVFDPEQIKKSFNEGIDNINKFVDSARQGQQKQ